MRTEAFYANPRLTALALLFIVVMGAMAFSSLARQEDPTMTERWARVTTFQPGATAKRMESLVSVPIETALREIPEVDEITSTSRAGLSVIGVQLYDDVGPERVEGIWSEVRDKLGDISPTLPMSASDPELIINKPLASTLILKLSWQAESAAEMGLLSRVAESLRLKLANLSGTEIAESWGAAEEEMLVTIDPYRLSDAGLTPDMIANAVARADTKAPAGRLQAASAEMLIEVDAELSSERRIKDIPLVSGDNAQLLTVGDVADVKKHRLDPQRSIALHQGEQVIFINAKMQPGLRIGDWTDRAMVQIAQFESELPNQIGLDVVYNQSVYTGERMDSLGMNLLTALVIVLVALIWFMGVRSALTVAVALPLSGAMVLIGMQMMSIPLHQMSITGLIISLGLLIDNAIVVVEDYKLRRRKGAAIQESIKRAVSHLYIPLGASTATTVFAFMPIAVSPGGVGDFTGTLGVTVALSVVSSFILAMTVVPAVAGFLERRFGQQKNSSERWWHSGYSNPAITARFQSLLRVVVRKPMVGIAIACVLPLIGFGLSPTLTNQFFPPVDRNQFQVQLSLPAHSSLRETRAAVARADAILKANPDVVDSFWTLGEGAPRVFYNVVSLNERVPSFASAWVNTTSSEATERILPELQAALAQALPEGEVLAIPFEQGPPIDAPIEVRLLGDDLNVLRDKALELRGILATVDGVTYTRESLSSPEPKLTFVPDESAAAIAGLSTGELSNRLNAVVSGIDAGTVQEGDTELGVRVRVGDGYRDQISDLSSLPVLTSAGRQMPLDALGEWELVPTPTAIHRRDGSRVATVQGFVTPFLLPAGVLADFQEKILASGFQMPSGYSYQVGGEAEQSSESVGNIVSMFVFFALAMAAVVVLSLNSFRQAALIGSIAILSFGLALFGVRLFGYPFGYMALIGALGMMGLAINGAIIVLSALKANPRATEGDADAIVSTVTDSSRHIISTTVTTVGGFVPLIVAGGSMWPPLATAIVGGVGGSAIIALIMVPAVFSWLHPSTEDRVAKPLPLRAGGFVVTSSAEANAA